MESRRSLRMQARSGGRDPVYTTSLGKAMLAFLPETEWPIHLPERLIERTSQSLTDYADLRREPLQTQGQGYAIDENENEDGVCCVGVPIFNHQEQVVAAISISAPASRVNNDLQQEMTEALLEIAQEISQSLGHNLNGAG